MSRILLTVLIGAAMAPALYWMFGGYPVYGSLLLFGGVALLIWLWWPRKKGTKAK
jgi:hypothetical protein